ncbi:MAG: ABC transporter permease [Acetobacteraceae bacterium]|nr:ABC transporter permease [Acetobacteraceae bacterium]
MRRGGIAAFLLVLPLLLLLVLSFALPVGRMLWTAVADPELSDTLPDTAAVLRAWNGEGLPPEEAFAHLARELGAALADRRLGPLAQRLNFEQPGLRALLLRTARAAGELREAPRERLIALDPRWGEAELWRLLRSAAGPVTALYLLRAVDLRLGPAGGIEAVAEEEAIYRTLFLRTLWIAALVTALCVVLAYPVAAALAALPQRLAAWGLVLVLVPFWTSVLVRTTAWFVLLQREGPLNAAAIALGLIEHPLQLIGTRFAVVAAMVHVLLPFAILPAYAVMRRLDPALPRAAASLGAGAVARFFRVHLPLSFPGVAAGGAMVFLLAVGYYITPALVGGPRDQMVASFIAFFLSQTPNWGMAAALSLLLLTMTGAAALAARALLPGFGRRE